MGTVPYVFRASSLSDPVFDVHYNARRGGASDRGAKSIPYALVITIEAKHMADLYNKIALLSHPTRRVETGNPDPNPNVWPIVDGYGDVPKMHFRYSGIFKDNRRRASRPWN